MTSEDHDFGYPTGVHGRIPSFNNVEEEAAFWDTHDVTDFLEEAQSIKVVRGLGNRLTVRLDPADREALEHLAEAKGVGPSTLVRMWVKDHLQREVAAQSR
ncbi:MAG: BrnA antitoxin family protein [Chloroflexota bacterium]|nr:BrnA antitoxin family protein [Chloroflexota bacterium]